MGTGISVVPPTTHQLQQQQRENAATANDLRDQGDIELNIYFDRGGGKKIVYLFGIIAKKKLQ